MRSNLTVVFMTVLFLAGFRPGYVIIVRPLTQATPSSPGFEAVLRLITASLSARRLSSPETHMQTRNAIRDRI